MADPSPGTYQLWDSPTSPFPRLPEILNFISLEDLIEEGVLTKRECDRADFGKDPVSVDYAKMYKSRMALLRKAYERSNIGEDPDFRRFQRKRHGG